MNNILIIVSLLDGKGPTGVEAHFNELIDQARAHGIDARLVSPFPSHRPWTKLTYLARRVLAQVSREQAQIFSTCVAGLVIKSKLMEILSSKPDRDFAFTLYAQDPLSAKIALKIKARHKCRVVTVIHFNVSVADELLVKGEATMHGPLWRFAARTEESVLPYVDQVIFVSDYMRRVLLQRIPKMAEASHTVIPNFVGEQPYTAPCPAIAGDLIAIGTLEPRKNHAFLLHVLARARQRGFCYSLTIVGSGPEQARLAHLARELDIVEQVNFAGFRKNAARMIPHHRVLAHAALMENMPISLIEALAAGRPILAPAVGGITEVFDDAVEGYHWPLDNVDAAAALLIKVLSDADIYTRFSSAALSRYRSKFCSSMLVRRWLTALLDTPVPNHSSIPRPLEQHAS